MSSPWLSSVSIIIGVGNTQHACTTHTHTHTHTHTVDDTSSAIAEELRGDLPSNKLQSHERVNYVGDTVYPSEEQDNGSNYMSSLSLPLLSSCCTVTDLEVLDSCQFTSKLAYAHQLKKQYEGVYQVHSHIFSMFM